MIILAEITVLLLPMAMLLGQISISPVDAVIHTDRGSFFPPTTTTAATAAASPTVISSSTATATTTHNTHLSSSSDPTIENNRVREIPARIWRKCTGVWGQVSIVTWLWSSTQSHVAYGLPPSSWILESDGGGGQQQQQQQQQLDLFAQCLVPLMRTPVVDPYTNRWVFPTWVQQTSDDIVVSADAEAAPSAAASRPSGSLGYRRRAYIFGRVHVYLHAQRRAPYENHEFVRTVQAICRSMPEAYVRALELVRSNKERLGARWANQDDDRILHSIRPTDPTRQRELLLTLAQHHEWRALQLLLDVHPQWFFHGGDDDDGRFLDAMIAQMSSDTTTTTTRTKMNRPFHHFLLRLLCSSSGGSGSSVPSTSTSSTSPSSSSSTTTHAHPTQLAMAIVTAMDMFRDGDEETSRILRGCLPRVPHGAREGLVRKAAVIGKPKFLLLLLRGFDADANGGHGFPQFRRLVQNFQAPPPGSLALRPDVARVFHDYYQDFLWAPIGSRHDGGAGAGSSTSTSSLLSGDASASDTTALYRLTLDVLSRLRASMLQQQDQQQQQQQQQQTKQQHTQQQQQTVPAEAGQLEDTAESLQDSIMDEEEEDPTTPRFFQTSPVAFSNFDVGQVDETAAVRMRQHARQLRHHQYHQHHHHRRRMPTALECDDEMSEDEASSTTVSTPLSIVRHLAHFCPSIHSKDGHGGAIHEDDEDQDQDQDQDEFEDGDEAEEAFRLRVQEEMASLARTTDPRELVRLLEARGYPVTSLLKPMSPTAVADGTQLDDQLLLQEAVELVLKQESRWTAGDPLPPKLRGLDELYGRLLRELATMCPTQLTDVTRNALGQLYY